MNIRTKQFQILTDIELVWKLMTDVYDDAQPNGPAAPFFEYAVTSSWLNKEYLRLNRFWFDGDLPVGFVFYENPVTATFFVLRPGYEALAEEMVDYALSAYPAFDEPRELVFHSGQHALMAAAEKRGYRLDDTEADWTFDFRKGKLEYPLPEGYHFVEPETADLVKIAKCMWDGFNSEEFGPFTGWEKPQESDDFTPHSLYYSVLGGSVSPSPHATYHYNTIVADENDEYVCFSGMWWVPENHLAYMEPLCTVPGHRRKGIAAAALSEHDRILRPLGARIMTGGGAGFYPAIGYQDVVKCLHYVKN